MKTKYLILVFISSLILTGIGPDYLLSQVIEVPGDYPTIQQAIDAGVEGDTVLVAEGTYFENLQITSKSITLASHFLTDGDTSHISKTIIDGSQPQNTDQASVIWVRWSEAVTVISGLTITGGYGTKTPLGERVGGGINAVNSSLTINNCRIINNVISKARVPDTYEGTYGGGIAIFAFEGENLSIAVQNNLIEENYIEGEMTAGGGMAIMIFDAINLCYAVENNIIRNNIVKNKTEWKAMGGGIVLEFFLPSSGYQVIRNNIISDNQALCTASFGGAMYILIGERSAGGAPDCDPGPYIYNNIISGNHSDYLGGGIAVWRVFWPDSVSNAQPLTSKGHFTPKPSFINNTIVNNTAQDGSGFYIMNHIPFLMNNILWNNYPAKAQWGEIFLGNEPTWTSWVESNKYGGVEIYNSDVKGDRWADIDNGVWNIDPAFTDTLYHLSQTSPGIGTGRSLVELNGIAYHAPDDDIEGNARPHSTDTFVDLGAYESSHMAQARPLSRTIRSDGFYINPYQISPFITTEVVNPHGENLKVYAHLQIPDSGEVVTTAELYDDGSHNDQQAGDHVYGGAFEPFNTETMLNLFLSVENISRGTTIVFADSNRFTSVGPVVLESVRNVSSNLDTIVNAGDILKFKFTVRNNSSSVTAVNVSSRVVTLDTCALIPSTTICSHGDLAPGASLEGGSAQYIRFNKNCAGQTAHFAMHIYSNNYNFWTDTFAIDILTGMEESDYVMIKEFSLQQNYPNPFNPKTVISYKLQVASKIDLSVYDLFGKKVATLVSGKQPAGSYEVEWDAANFASGIYFYRLSTGSGFIQTRKMVVLK